MKVLMSQLNPTIGDIAGNTKKIIECLSSARDQGIDVVLFPELAICGYPPEDLLLRKGFVAAIKGALDQIIQASSGLFVVVGVIRKNPQPGEKPLLNSAAVIENGRLIGFQDKWLLPTYDVFDERRYFEPGTETQIWEYKGVKYGITICEDIWGHAGCVDLTHYAHDPIRALKAHHPDVLLNLSASPYHYQKPDTRAHVCVQAAKTLGCPILLCCQVGGNDQLVFDGYSMYVDKDGQLGQIAKGFEEDQLIIDLSQKANAGSLRYDPLHDLYSALVLGVKDYFYKSGFKKACLGLSGGIDSALVACIAVEALGKENVVAIAMPSRFSSIESLQDARSLALNLGITLEEVSIETPFQSFLDLLGPYFENRVADVTEENLQARIRGMILMAFSNKFGYVVLSTGNKSELAMGYCTLYGDMCGGLSVISDVIKTQVYTLSRWINRNREIIPVSTIDKPPSAELKPNQKDTDSLPDYDIVDKVLQGYIEDYLSPEETATKYQLSLELVLDLVKRIHKAEYKRRQAPPGIRVSKKAFPVGRRYPIVQKWV
ncbi:MAG: NAD+ synthase [Chlamydiae bacterium]|nr:NAD+ synthase [Chlamydiota bacterium]